MMGVGHTKRSDLIRLRATGESVEYSRWVLEVLFQSGHDIEALARPIAEGFLGDELFPVTATDDDGYLSASFDGVTMCESIIWECKSWNESKAADVLAGVLPEVDYWQVVQQLVVSRAEYCVYMVTDGAPENTVTLKFVLDPADEEKLLASWALFDAEVATYEHREAAPVVVGRAPDQLPTLRIDVTGMVTASNLDAFREHALAVFGGINRTLVTDTDFANAESTIKWCKGAEDKLKSAKSQALSQTSSIESLFLAIDEIDAEARSVRLELEKLVKSRKEALRSEILNEHKAAWVDYVDELNSGLQGNVSIPHLSPDFAGAMKGKRNFDSLRDACGVELARVKVEASSIAAKIAANLELLRTHAAGFDPLFADLRDIVLKDKDDLLRLVQGRIAEYEENERKRRAEERAERDRREAAAAVPVVDTPVSEPAVPVVPAAIAGPETAIAEAPSAASGSPRPSDRDIVLAVAKAFNCPASVALSWIAQIGGPK